MTAITKTTETFTPEKPVLRLRVRRMRLIMALCLLEVVPAILVILSYLGFPLMQLANINQLFIFLAIVGLTSGLTSGTMRYLALAAVLLLISLINAFSLSGIGDFNFEADAIFPYYYSILMPTMVFVSIYSQKCVIAKTVIRDLRWFSKWFVIVISPIIVVYAALHFSGKISYFGFGVSFHYVTPYFLHRGGMIFLLASLILISGKRAVLINFLAQLFLFKGGEFRRSPIPILFTCFLLLAVLIFVWDDLAFFLRRFTLMLEVLNTIDLSDGILGLANSYAAIVLFGGRLEEIVGIVEYFTAHPTQIWFGSPPGANYIWRVEISDLETVKSYAHLTWFGYIFRFGIIPTGALLIAFIYRLVSGWDTRNPLWLVYFGILLSATFGGNLFYSPVAWTMIALYFRFGAGISEEIRRERGYKNWTYRPSVSRNAQC
ncbi:hypothetical protein [Sulfitobacter faviae]|uniref:hypothetical protein n=1 Tax=Sulfitobacter faviae TaxID=1775881 RepID=UPI00398CE85D